MKPLPEESDSAASRPQFRSDELAGELLDVDGVREGIGPLTTAEVCRIADLQWLDSLLEACHGRQTEATQTALDATLNRIRADVQSTRLMPASGSTAAADLTHQFEALGDLEPQSTADCGRRPRHRAFFSSSWRKFITRSWHRPLAAVLMMIAACGLWWSLQPDTALALVDQAQRAASIEQDRTYEVTLTPPHGPPLHQEGLLQVRGARRLVYSHAGRGPLGARFLIGINRDEYWFIPPVGPALIHDQEGILAQWLNQVDADLPFLHLEILLDRLRHDYELRPGPAESLVTGGPTLARLSGQLRPSGSSATPLVPTKVEAWIDRQSGVIHQMILNFASRSNPTAPAQITLRLIGEEPQSEDYFELSHHANRRRVLDLRTQQGDSP